MNLNDKLRWQHPGFIVIVIFLMVFGSFVCQAQTIQDNPQTSQSKPGKTVVPAMVLGKIEKDGKGVQGIKVKLTRLGAVRYIRKPRQLYPTKVITDKNGRYSFKVAARYIGKKFRITPQHPVFPPGKHFWPQREDFVLALVTRKNFSFYPPKYYIQAIPKGPEMQIMRGAEIRIDQVLGYGKYKLIKREVGAGLNFGLDFDYYGKRIRVHVRHPMVATFGTGFTPMFKTFTLKKSEKFIFVYNGPLPDLIIAGINKPSKNWVVIKIKNTGNLAAGKFLFQARYRIFRKGSGASTKEQITTVNGLAPGESRDISYGINYANTTVKLIWAYVDSRGDIVESDRLNNKYPENIP